MPGAVSQTSTYGLTNATMPYVRELAEKGWEKAIEENPALRNGLNIADGKIYHPAVARAFGRPSASLPAA
jgi:alanine dehydrogenase